MICEKYKNKECVGKFWCGICSEHLKEFSEQFRESTDKEKFALQCQQEMFKKHNEMVKNGRYDKAASYYSCIQIMEKYLKLN